MDLANKGLLVVLSAPSGGGKDTVLAELKKHGELNIKQSISATTRAPREGEVDGKDYYFISVDDFKSKIDEGFFLEYVNYGSNFYGTPRSAAQKLIDDGYSVILKIEVEGAANIKKIYPDAVSVFLSPPSFDVLKSRLRARGTETDEEFAKRVAIAKREYERACEYDYVVINDDLQQCVADICDLLKIEKYRYSRMKAFVDDIIENN